MSVSRSENRLWLEVDLQDRVVKTNRMRVSVSVTCSVLEDRVSYYVLEEK